MLRSLLVSALVAGSAIVLSAPNVNAQSVNMPFTGTIAATGCTFGTPTTGTLAPTPNVNPTTLSGFPPIGTQSSVRMDCTAPPNMTISAPIQTSGPTFTPTSCTVELLVPRFRVVERIRFESCAGTNAPTLIDNTGDLVVNMSVSNPAGIPSGTYGYNVTLSIVP
jgi:hypothetical protein